MYIHVTDIHANKSIPPWNQSWQGYNLAVENSRGIKATEWKQKSLGYLKFIKQEPNLNWKWLWMQINDFINALLLGTISNPTIYI